jgi:hypothetical protein
MSLMSLILILAGNFFVLIICLTGAQVCYFKKNWKWFFLMLVCILLSAACMFVEAYPWIYPEAQMMHVVVRQPTTPL